MNRRNKSRSKKSKGQEFTRLSRVAFFDFIKTHALLALGPIIEKMLKTKFFQISLFLALAFFAGPFLFTPSAQAGKFTNTACISDGLGDGTYDTPPAGGETPTPLGSTTSNAVQNQTCAADNVNQIVQNSSSITGGYGRIRKFTFFTSGDIRIQSIKTTVARQMIARNSTLPCIWFRVTSIVNATYEDRDCVSSSVGSVYLNPSNLGTTTAGRNYTIDISSEDIEALLGNAGFAAMDSVEIWLGLYCVSATSCAGRSTTSERQRIAWSDWEITYNNNISDFLSGFNSSTETCSNEGLIPLRPTSFCPTLTSVGAASPDFTNNWLFSSDLLTIGSNSPLVVKCNDANTQSCGTLAMEIPYSATSPMGVKGLQAKTTTPFFNNGDILSTCTSTSTTAANTNLGVSLPCSSSVSSSPSAVYASLGAGDFDTKVTPSFAAIDTGTSANLISDTSTTSYYILDINKPTATFTSQPASYTTGSTESTTTPSTIGVGFQSTDASGVGAVNWDRSTNSIVADTNTGLCPATSPTTWADARTSANSSLDSTSASYPSTLNENKTADLAQGSGATDGNCYYLRAQPTDRPGWDTSGTANTTYSNTATSDVFIYDSVLPTMSLSSCSSTNPATNNGWYNKANLDNNTLPSCTMTAYDNASRPADDGGRLEYSLDNSTWSSPDTITFDNSTGNPATGDTGEKTRTKTDHQLAADNIASKNGSTVYFRAYGYDRSGRKSSNATTGAYKIDTVDPTIDTASPTFPSSPAADTVTFGSLTATDVTSKVNIVRVQYSTNGTTWNNLPGGACAQTLAGTNNQKSSSSCNLDTNNLSDGTYTFRYQVEDTAGNTNTTAASSSVQVLNTISLSDAAATVNVSSSATPATGTTSDAVITQASDTTLKITSVPSWSFKVCVPDSSQSSVFRAGDFEVFPADKPLQVQVQSVTGTPTVTLPAQTTKSISKNCTTSTDWLLPNRTGQTVSPRTVATRFIQALPWSVGADTGGKQYTLPIQYSLSPESTS